MKRSILTLFAGIAGIALGNLVTPDAAFAGGALPAVPKGSVLISLAAPGGDQAGWKDEKCRWVQESLKALTGGKMASECVKSAPAEAALISRHTWLVRLERANVHRFSVTIKSSTARDDAEPKMFGWHVDTAGKRSSEAPAVQRYTLHGILNNFFHYEVAKPSLKKLLLSIGVEDSLRIGLNTKGEYVDVKDQVNLTPEQAYQRFVRESPKHKHYVRAALETTALLGIEAAYLYLVQLDSGASRPYPLELNTLREKLTGAGMRFDNNRKVTNRFHAISGAAFAQIARANGLSATETFLYAFTASAVWEAFVEYQSVFSINDQIVTSVGGFYIGEALHQIGKHFASGPDTVARRIISTVFDSPSAFHRWIDGASPRTGDISQYGFNTRSKGYLDLYAGLDAVYGGKNGRSATPGVNMGFQAEVVNIPMFDRPGKVSRLYTDTVFAEAAADLTIDQSGVNRFVFLTRATLAAYYQKNVELDEKARLNGYNFWIGPGGGVEYRDNNFSAKDNDWMAIINVIGPQIDMTYYAKGVKIRATIGVYGDFAMMHSYAIDAYDAAGVRRAGLPTVLSKGGYYYGFGATEYLRVAAEYGRWEIGFGITNHDIFMISGRDQQPEKVNYKPDVSDSLTEAEVWVGYDITTNTRVVVSLKLIRRKGTMDQYEREDTETRVTGRIVHRIE